MNIYKNYNVTDEELASFLDGTLPERREKEVADAIDGSKELQSIIEATMDIEDMMMFEELRLLKSKSQTNKSQSNLAVPVADFSPNSKWGMYLSKDTKSQKNASTWGEEDYRKAADRDTRKLTKLKSLKRVETKEYDSHSYWIEIIVGIIIMALIVLVKSCI